MANTYDSMKKQLQDEAYRKMLNEFMNSGAMANSSLAQKVWAQQSPAAAYTAHGYGQRKAQGGGVTAQEIETLTSPSFYTPESYGEFNKGQVRQAIIDQTAFINMHRNEGIWDVETNDPSWWSDKYLAEQLAGYDDQIWREKTIEELINASTGYGWKYSNMSWDELLDEMMGDEELASPYVENWLRAYNLSVPADSRMTLEQLQAISDPVARTAVYNDLQRRFAGNIDALLESGMYRVTEPGQATASESLTFRKERAQKEQANRQTAAEYQAKLADPQYRNTMAMATASGQVEVDGKTYPNLWLWATNTGNTELLNQYEEMGYGFLLPEELVMYQQLYEINPADAMGYLDILSRVLNVRRKAFRDAEKSLKATDGFWNGIISWAEALGTPIENILTGDILRQTYHAWKGDADPNAYYFDAQNDQSIIRGAQNAEIKEKFGSTAAFFYDAFNSIADVGLTTGLDIALGGTGLVNAGLNATKAYSGGLQSNAARDIQGLWSVGQALGDAGIEALFEKLGFDGSTKSANKIWNFLRNAFGEGAEEVFTNMGTTAFDAVMSAAQGRDNTLVEMYKAYTLAGAENPGMQVALDKAAELGMDATMGTIAGGTLGGVQSAADAISTRNLGKSIAPTANEDALLEIARAMPEGSESRRLANKYFPQALTGDVATEETTESKEPAAKSKKPGKLEPPVELTGEAVPDAEPEKAEGKAKKHGKIEKPVELTGEAVPEPETEVAKAKAKKPSLEGEEVALDGEAVPDKETPAKKAEKPGKLEKPVELTGEAVPDVETAESTRTKEEKKAEKPAAPKKGKLSFYQLGRLTQALEVDLHEEQSRITNDVMDQAIANRLMELGDDAATARKNASAIRKLYRGQEVTLTERSGLAWNKNASQVTKELASTIKEGEEGRVGNSWRAAMGAVAEKATVQVRDMQTQLREALTNKKSVLNGAISTAKSKAAKVARGSKNVTSKMVTISDGESGTESKGEFRRFKKHGSIMEMVVFSDGAEKTVSVEDMAEAEGSGMAEIIEYVADGGTHDMSEAEANTLAQVYQSVGGDADSVIRNYEMVYLSGYTGMAMPSNALPDAEAKAVYDRAKAEAVADEKTRVDRAKAVRRTTNGLVTFLGKVSKDSEVRGAGSEVALSEAMEGMTDSQQQTVEVVRAFAHKFRINVVLFESADEGVSTMQNGSYDQNTHTVYIDINSGANSTDDIKEGKERGTLGYAMVLTLGHEVTHAIESTSAEGYAAYKAAVKEKLGRQWNSLVQEKLANALNVGRKLTLQGAEAEVVADASEYMLQDTKFVGEIDKTVRGKVKAVISDFVEKVRSIFEGFGVKGAHRESQALRRIQDNVYHYLDNLQQLWDVAAEEMVSKSEETVFDETESYDAPLTEETASEGKVLPELPTQHSNRDAQTSTPQFQRWFGESKVVDASGQPKVMYHGTRTDKDFTVFDTWGSNFGLFGVGSYFTDDKTVAEGYTRKGKGNNPRVYEVYLSIENPLDMDAAYDPAIWQTDDQYLNRMFEGSQTNEDAFRRLKEYCADEDMERGEAEEFITDFIVSKGFDGIRHTGGGRYNKGDTNRHEVYIAFEPEQIKSATDNVGTFDRENPDIRYSQRNTTNAYYGVPFDEQVRELINGNVRGDGMLLLGRTPKVLRDIGLSDLPLMMDQSHARKLREGTTSSTNDDHILSWKTIKNLPALISDPVAVVLSANDEYRTKTVNVIIEAENRNGKQVYTAIALDAVAESSSGRLDINKAATVFGNDSVLEMFNAAVLRAALGGKEVLYLNNKKAAPLYHNSSNLKAGGAIGDGLINTIADADVPVKSKGKKQTETQQFKRWFGESEVVTEDGDPLIVYHTTNNEFYSFDKERLGEVTDSYASDGYIAATAHVGMWFSTEQLGEMAGGNRIMPVYLSVQQMYEAGTLDGMVAEIWETYSQSGNDYDTEDPTIEQAREAGEFYRSVLENRGYDGIKVKDTEFGGYSYIVFEPEQIKSATDNVGTFDPQNPDIRYSTRDNAPGMTAREFIADSDDSIAATVEERNALGIYKNLLLKHADASDKVIAAEQVLAAADDADMPEARKALSAARAQQRELYNRLLNVERTEHVQNVVNRTNELIGMLYGKTAKQAEKSAAELEREIESLRLDLQALKVAARTQRESDIREKEWVVRQLNSKAAQALLAANERYAQNLSNLRARNELNLEIGKQARHIKRIVKRLNDRIIHEEDYKNVKEPLKPAVRTLVRTFIDGFGGMVFNQNTASHLRTVYDALARDGDDGAPEFYSDDVSNWLADLAMLAAEDAERRAAGGSGMQAVEQKLAIYTRAAEIADHIYKMVKGADELFVSGKRESFAAMSAEVGSGLLARDDKTLRVGATRDALRVLDDLLRTGNMTPTYFFDHLGNSGLSRLFGGMMEAQTQYAQQIREGQQFMEDAKRRYNFYAWQNMRNGVEFRTEQGHTISLTVPQMMWVYATAKRESTNRLMDTHHLDQGGFRYAAKDIPRVSGKIGKGIPGSDKLHRLAAGDVRRITATLTAEQKACADELVGFLSTTCAEWGNAASMEMFGIRKYNEEYYFPFKTDSDQRYQRSDAGSTSTTNDARVKHSSFTHSLRKGANTPLVMGDFFEVIADHINQMATYSSFVVSIESMNRVLNAKVNDEVDGSGSNVSIRSLVGRKYGEPAQKYMADLMKDMNGGPNTDNRGKTDALFRAFKRGAVMGSLSVALQQPTAIVRAFAYIHPRYFAHVTMEGNKRTWARMLAHSGTAVIKDMGKFDVGVGRTAKDWIENSGLQEFNVWRRGRFLLHTDGWNAVKNNWVEWATQLPGVMDRITWTHIWKAVEAEQADLHPDMNPNSDEFLDMVGRRFDDVINHTQVYDSILSKSQNMRSKNAFAQMSTAFMAEPTLSINMLYDALRGNHSAGKRAGIIASVLGSGVLASAAASLIAAWNKDDDERKWGEQLVAEFASRAIDSVNPLTMIPYVSDLWNVVNGYDIERTDLSVLKDISDYTISFISKAADPEKSNSWRDYENLFGTIANLTGIPAKNISRDIRRVRNLIVSDKGTSTSAELRYTVLEEITPFGLYDSSNKAYCQRLIAAVLDGDTQEAYDLWDYLTNSKKATQDSLNTNLRNELKRRVKEKSITPAEATKILRKYAPYKDDNDNTKKPQEWLNDKD